MYKKLKILNNEICIKCEAFLFSACETIASLIAIVPAAVMGFEINFCLRKLFLIKL